ncbi:MAG: hypothetical protein AAGE52_13925, partial [Myxococcota bacterium]
AVDGCVERTFYRDSDGDERGDPTMSMSACEAPDGFVEDATDCNDDCNVCWTDNAEACDGEDNDCDGFSDEGLLVPVGEPVPVATTNGDDRALGAAPLSDGRILVAYTDADGMGQTIAFAPSTGVSSPINDGFDGDQFLMLPSVRGGDAALIYDGVPLTGRTISRGGVEGDDVMLRRSPDGFTPVQAIAATRLQADEVALVYGVVARAEFRVLDPNLTAGSAAVDPLDGIAFRDAPIFNILPVSEDVVHLIAIFDPLQPSSSIRFRVVRRGVPEGDWIPLVEKPNLASVASGIDPDGFLDLGFSSGPDMLSLQFEVQRFRPEEGAWASEGDAEAFGETGLRLLMQQVAYRGSDALFLVRDIAADMETSTLEAFRRDGQRLELGAGRGFTDVVPIDDGFLFRRAEGDETTVSFRALGCE